MSVEESNCEAHFVATTTRADTGQFVVELPKKLSVLSLMGTSYEIAKRRFLSVERRLQAKPKLKVAYSVFIDEYRVLRHMKEVTDISQPTMYQPYYLPHHCIERPDSVTTKLRVVFDAFCVTDSNISLNNSLMMGPVVQGDLFSLILRWQTHRYVIVADTEKMYRKIQMHPPDQCLQRILWRDDPSEPIRMVDLTTVTYGTSAAPYLATRCLQEVSKLGQHSHPMAAKVVGEDFYMDDLITGKRFIGPLIVVAKLFVQQLWQSNRSWDEPLEDELQKSWLKFRTELTVIESIDLPRWVVSIVNPTFIELHGFCFASEMAYGACVYLRAVSSRGEILVHLLTSKSKLAPLGNSKKQIKVSLARLELSSALLLSHLFQKVPEALNLQMKYIFWTAYLLRFCHNCKQQNSTDRKTGFLQVGEYKEALKVLVRQTQQDLLKKNIEDVVICGEVGAKSSLKSLAPILQDGILKVGDR